MSPITYGGFKLSSVAGLPNIQVAFPGEHWSDGKAATDLTPGELVVPINSGGKLHWQRAASGAVDARASIALNTVQHPDLNVGSNYAEALGPNQILNRTIKAKEWVHAYRSGAFHLTLFVAAVYVPGDLLTYNPAGTPQTDKTSLGGAWEKTAVAANALLEVIEFRALPDTTNRGILTVKTLRSQF